MLIFAALRIHLSCDTAKLMQEHFPEFELESRGERQVKVGIKKMNIFV